MGSPKANPTFCPTGKTSLKGYSIVPPQEQIHTSEFVCSESRNMRAGVLPFCKIDGVYHILLAVKAFREIEHPDAVRCYLWTDFGGYPQGNETAIATAQRELNEEFGGPLTGILTSHHSTDGMKTRTNPDVVQQCIFMMDVGEKSVSRRFCPNDEIVNVKWIPFGDFLKLPPERMSRSLRLLHSLFGFKTVEEIFYGDESSEGEWVYA